MFSRIRKERGDQGFTLIELLVVIIIIGILAAIAIPVFLNQRKKGWDAAVQADLRNAVTSEETYLTANGVYTNDMADLEGVGFKYSADSNYFVTPAAITADIDAGNSYCLSTQSASGDYFSFGSTSGLSNDGPAAALATNNDGTCE